MHLAILDPGTRVPELDCFNRIARNSPLVATYHLPAQQGLDSLHRQPDVAGVVILGSGASVHDDEPWQLEMNAWVREQIARDVPMLGLCYGHQLLAHLLGGTIGFVREDQEKLRGVRDVPLLESAIWPAGTRPLVISHREQVVDTPPGCVNLGATAEVPVEAFAHRDRAIWGIQAHPEATTAFTTNNGIPFEADPRILSGGHALVDAFSRFVAARVSS